MELLLLLAGGVGTEFIFEFVVDFLLSGGGGPPGVDVLFCVPTGGAVD